MVQGKILLSARDTFSLKDFFSDNFLTFTKFPHISLTAIKFADISRFSSHPQQTHCFSDHFPGTRVSRLPP